MVEHTKYVKYSSWIFKKLLDIGKRVYHGDCGFRASFLLHVAPPVLFLPHNSILCLMTASEIVGHSGTENSQPLAAVVHSQFPFTKIQFRGISCNCLLNWTKDGKVACTLRSTINIPQSTINFFGRFNVVNGRSRAGIMSPLLRTVDCMWKPLSPREVCACGQY